jgi:hypothetical protein
MELAAMTHVPDNINPTTVKPMELSFIWYFLYRFHYTGQRAPANRVPRQSVAATNTEEAPAFGGTGGLSFIHGEMAFYC